MHRDEGAASVEHVALLLLVATLVLALVLAGIGPAVVEGVRRALCLIFIGEGCDEPAGPPAPDAPVAREPLNRLELPCLAARNTLDWDANVLVKGVLVAGSIGYVIDQVGVQTFRVTFYSEGSLGAGFKAGPELGGVDADWRYKAGRFANGQITAGTRGAVSYDFATRDQAEAFAHDVREWLRYRPEAAQMILEESLGAPGRLASGFIGWVGRGINWLGDKVLRREPAPEPSFTHATVNLKLGGEAGLNTGRFPSAAGGGAGELSGVLTEIHLAGPANGWKIFTGSEQIDGSVLAAYGTPALTRGGGRGGAWRWRVIFDKDDEPIRVTLIHESTEQATASGTFGREGRSQRGGGGAVGYTDSTIAITEWNLDLRDENNRAAFDHAFFTVPGLFAAPYSAVSQPTPEVLATWAPLLNRMAEDGVTVRLEYDESAPNAGVGGGGGTAGAEVAASSPDRDLVSATITDARWDDPEERRFEACWSDDPGVGPPVGGSDLGGS